ncbi:MAG: hypothetical protein N3G19_02840 [Candidatus Pacearchaeota archaeon]|nr:hypothetical protein [Candidatus Pacearchaeota archaeon]
MALKRGKLLLFLIIVFVLILISSNFALAQEQENIQIKKAYLWLQSKSLGKWQNLNLQQHVFSILALKEKLTQSQIDAATKALLQKSQNNGTCWPSTNCNALDTALAKIALDSLNKDSSKASEWLLNKTITPTAIGGNWLLQLIQLQDNAMICRIKYNTTEISVEFDKKGIVSSLSNAECFTNATYWLQLNQQCFEKEFNITCNDSFMGNFLFEKPSAPKEYYIVSAMQSAQPLGVISLKLITKCIQQGADCNYEATLWTAYAFTNQPSISRSFVPYLVMKADENNKLLPQAILYKLTSQQSYADAIASLQGTDGLIVAPSTLYNKYHDTGLASMTGSVVNANITKIKEKLLQQQIKTGANAGSWECLGCDSIRETAMLLYGIWPAYEWRSPCEQEGYSCVANCSAINGALVSLDCYPETYQCCNASSSFNCEMKYGTCKPSCSAALNETQVPYSCQNGVCCKNYSISLCISEIQGQICSSEQECIKQGSIVPFIYSSDSTRCCLGICTTASKTCSEAGGEYCDPSEGKSCPGNKMLQATDTLYCCQQGYCVQGLQTCSQMHGMICDANEDCKDGTFVVASDTNGQATCCIQGGTCIPSSCNYNKCEEEENCVGNSYETSDALKCCEGQCLVFCSKMRGTPCNVSMSCKGTLKQASDYSRCCIGECKAKGKFPWFIIIIVIVIAIVVFLFYLIKTGKIKFKGKKAVEPKLEFGFPIMPRGIPPRGMPPMPMMPPKQPQLKPIPTKAISQKPMPQQKPAPSQPSQAPAMKKKLPAPPKPSK